MADLSTAQRAMRSAIGVLAILLALGGGLARAADEGLPDRAGLMAKLRAGHFADLDAELARIEDAVEAHRLPERNVDYAFHSFANSDPALESRLDEWVAASPRSFAAFFARGRYILHLADLANWNATVSEVPADWSAKVESYRVRAAKDIGAALELEPNLTWAYSDLAELANVRGDHDTVERLFQAGVAKVPDSAIIQTIPFDNFDKSTKAGLRDLFAMIDELLAKYGDDPNFLFLRGYKDYTLADQVCRAGNHEKGIELATRALRATDLPSYLYKRAEIFRCANRHRDAIADYDTVLERTPDYAPAFYGRATSKFSLGLNEAALADYDHAIALDPLNPIYLKSRGWFYISQDRADQAEADYQQALVYGKYSTDVLSGMAFLYSNLRHEPAKSSEIYRQLASLDPWRSRWLYQYGFVLLRTNDCRAVEVLDRYMASCEAGAYCGRENDGWEPYPPDDLKFMLKGLQRRNSCPKTPSGP